MDAHDQGFSILELQVGFREVSHLKRIIYSTGLFGGNDIHPDEVQRIITVYLK